MWDSLIACRRPWTGTLRCLQKEMATYRHWSVSLWRDPRWCLTLSNPVPWQNWMAAYLGYTPRMKTLFRGWPVMAHETHTRRRRRLLMLTHWCGGLWTIDLFREVACIAARYLQLALIWSPGRCHGMITLDHKVHWSWSCSSTTCIPHIPVGLSNWVQ